MSNVVISNWSEFRTVRNQMYKDMRLDAYKIFNEPLGPRNPGFTKPHVSYDGYYEGKRKARNERFAKIEERYVRMRTISGEIAQCRANGDKENEMRLYSVASEIASESV